MAGYVMIRIETQALDCGQVTQQLQLDSTKPHEVVQQVLNLLLQITAGAPAQIEIATRTTTQAIAASGAGSGSASLNLK